MNAEHITMREGMSAEGRAMDAAFKRAVAKAVREAYTHRRWLLSQANNGPLVWTDKHGNTRPFTSHSDPEATERPAS